MAGARRRTATRVRFALIVPIVTLAVMLSGCAAVDAPSGDPTSTGSPRTPTTAGPTTPTDAATSGGAAPGDTAPSATSDTAAALTGATPAVDHEAELAAQRTLKERTRGRQRPVRQDIVRGVYSTMYSFWGGRWETILGLIETTELNAVVIDVKDDRGQLAWDMDLPLAREGGGADWRETRPGGDPGERLRQLIDRGGYPIARIVCFKDSYIAQARPDLAVVDVRSGQPWQGRDEQHWLNPYRDEAWQYCIDVAKEAAEVGFREIQFDYVRFPNGGDGPSEHFDFPGRPPDRPREQWRHPDEITEFLASARRQLHREGVWVAADIFGLTTYNWSWDGDGTGQVLERLAAELDYLSPMVYPSHYGPGNYGLLPHPVDHPYETVWNAMQEARMRSQGLRAKIRPWIEDFEPSWLGRGHSPGRVLEQKQAVYDNGLDGWMLWNAGNVFSQGALGAAPATSHADPDYHPPPRTKDPAPPPGREPVTWPGRPEDGDDTDTSEIGQGNAAGTSPGQDDTDDGDTDDGDTDDGDTDDGEDGDGSGEEGAASSDSDETGDSDDGAPPGDGE